MDRVGGYGDFLALQQDAGDFEDMMLVLEGESEAARLRALKARADRMRMEAERGRR